MLYDETIEANGTPPGIGKRKHGLKGNWHHEAFHEILPLHGRVGNDRLSRVVGSCTEFQDIVGRAGHANGGLIQTAVEIKLKGGCHIDHIQEECGIPVVKADQILQELIIDALIDGIVVKRVGSHQAVRTE